MKYAIIFLSGFLLAGCASNSKDMFSSPEISAAPAIGATRPFVANTNALALNTKLQQAYSSSENQVQVLRIGNEIKVTYPDDLLFGVGGVDLLSDSQGYLDVFVAAAKEYPEAKLRVDSFTDNSGIQANNIIRSQQRAENVARYLVDNGLPIGKMSLKGYGSDYPVASNETPEGRAENRRVVITIKVPAPVPNPVPQSVA